MEIDQTIAATIVANIKGVLRHEINLFDTHGTVIASTDAARIGQYHEAAAIAAASRRSVVVDDDHPYRGARNGINSPVLIDGNVAAVIGVTGERESVESFGDVIVKMTEILLHENIEQTARYNRRILETNLINQLIGAHQDTELIRYLSAALEWDMHARHCIVIGRLMHDGGDVVLLQQRHLQRIDDAIYTADADECCLLLGPSHHVEDTLRALAERFADDGAHMGFGVGEPTDDLSRLPHCYRHARLALDWQRFAGGERIVHADRLDYGLLLPSMQHDRMVQFVERVFCGLDEAAIERHRGTFKAYTRFNGSITHAAQSLFIHKNTMQNHLNAIAKDTGYNPRTLHDYAVLDMAFRVYDYLRFTTGDARRDADGHGTRRNHETA